MADNKRTIVICKDVGLYFDALTRGKHYEVLAEDEVKEQIRVVGDNNRARWFRKYYFVPDGSSVPVLVNWAFDDTIQDSSEESLEHIEITVTLSEGEKRWCSLCTKAGLLDYIERCMDDNVFLIENQVIVKNFSKEVVNDALKRLDQQNLLISSTKPFN
ncbi:hypothetical protein HPY31_13520 [Brevibacillus sp. HB1.3]|uniref:hypothetical protein n=1 Tax=Brevibacillus sp. HB1.3 TaxID=2738842 RepID=UPI00155281BA|nr:hypothetical protein [Brevibacillus sp. HB1.3]NQF14930.1 hypothetical protein [Brevibacillus sp. HB1.3]